MTPRPLGWFDADGDGAEDFERQKRYAAFTALFNVTGQPAVSVPLHWTDGGLPVGTMLVGRPADEATLLALSAQLEQARPWAHRHPPGWDDGCRRALAGKLSAVTVAETILVFAGIPLAVIVVLAALTLRPGGPKRPRYKPGQPWEHAPVWYEPHPDRHAAAGRGTPARPPGDRRRPATGRRRAARRRPRDLVIP